MEKVVKEHLQKHEIIEWEHFPDHDKRMETLEFRNAKHELEKVEHLPCIICGSMQNRESHHIFERAYANGLDYAKVAHFLFLFDFHGHVRRDFKDEKELLDWFITHFKGEQFEYSTEVPGGHTGPHIGYHCHDDALDTLYNQLILCKDHHRGEGTGIHGESTPSFFAWLARKEGYEPTFTKEEAASWVAEHEKEGGE